ncbi:MAG: HEPN domain-containing protein [Nitrospinae bacterium]|nr:HEPN domain-containing protein [Nitrospinota bacterium]
MNSHRNTLVQLRLKQASDAINDATFLLDQRRSSQSVVNRAYYAMFYSALALLQYVSKAPSKHSGVISLFDTEFVMKGIFPKEMSKDIHLIFEMRQNADYKATEEISADKASEACAKAQRFVVNVSQYLSDNLEQGRDPG